MSNTLFAAVTADDAAIANVLYFDAESHAYAAAIAADDAFRSSALTFVAAAEAGVKDVEIAKAVKALADDRGIKNPKGREGTLYTSPTSVGYHRRTGLALELGGELPLDEYTGQPVAPRSIQSLIKSLPTKVVDSILDEAETTADAYLALCKAVAAADKAAKAKTDEDDEDSDDEQVTTDDILRMLTAARGPLGKAIALAGEGNEVTAAALEVALEIVKAMDALADVAKAQAVTADDAAVVIPFVAA